MCVGLDVVAGGKLAVVPFESPNWLTQLDRKWTRLHSAVQTAGYYVLRQCNPLKLLSEHCL